MYVVCAIDSVIFDTVVITVVTSARVFPGFLKT